MNTAAFEVGQKVRPAASTKDGLTYGYVRSVETGFMGRRTYVIFWPDLGSTGAGWRDDDLRVA